MVPFDKKGIKAFLKRLVQIRGSATNADVLDFTLICSWKETSCKVYDS